MTKKLSLSPEEELKALRKEISLVKGCVENAPCGLAEISSIGEILFANRGYHELLEYPENDLIGKSIFDLIPTDVEKNGMIDLVTYLIKEKPVPTPWLGRYVTAKGRILDLRIDWNYIYDKKNRVIGFTQLAMDITGQLASPSIVESLNIYRHIVSSVRDGIAFIDREYRFLAVNEAFLKAHSRRREDIIGKKLDTVFKNSTFLRNIMEYIQRAFKGDEIHSMIWFETGNRQSILLDISLYPLRENNVITGLTISTRDVTQEIQMEMEILNAGERERRQIGIELHDGLSHELLGLAIQARILSESLEDRFMHEESVVVEKIEKGLNTTIGQVRNIAQGLFPPPMEKTEITYQLEKLKLQLQDTYGIQCETEFRGPVRIHDPKQAFHLSHIMQEAVLNIIRHSGAKNVYIGYVADDGKIILTIRDDGKGITHNPSGTGLGLNIMQYRATVIGARLDIHLLDTGGTELICTLRQHRLSDTTSKE